MAYELDPVTVDEAFDGGSVAENGRVIPFSAVIVGNLQATSGAIVACDPFVAMGVTPFLRTVPPGSYRTSIAVARFGDDERIAFAQLEIADRPVERWELATIGGQDAATLGPDAFFGYGVDSGTGCFMDAEAARLLDARMREEPDFFERMIETMDLTYRHTRSWAPVKPDDRRPENVLCFSSGFGDGSYPTFYGLDAGGDVVAFVTDFLVVGQPDATSDGVPSGSVAPLTRSRSRWRFWARG
jgi:hypothetical protein